MDAEARKRLVIEHMDMCRRAAAVVYPRVKEHVEFDELVALANTGLVEAASRYEEGHGATFNTFAWYRVHGAIIDGLRKTTMMPRRVWNKLVALRAASEYLEQRGERDLGAAKQGVPAPKGADALSAIKSALAAIRTVHMIALDAPTRTDDEGREESRQLAAETDDPDHALDTQRVGKQLREALDALPEKERELVKKHYFDGKNLMEAGEELGISKSWASRLHAQAIDKLRDKIDARLRTSMGALSSG